MEESNEDNIVKKITMEHIPKSYVCYKTTDKIKIDGDLNKAVWEEISWTEYFIDIEGKSTPAPKTRVKMRYNDEFFYVGAYLEEPNLVATLTEKNSVIYHDNDFEVFIDPNWSSHQYTEFEINAFNTIWGLLIINPYRDSYNIVNPYPLPGLVSAVKLYGTLNDPSDIDDGWSVEIAFPWNLLKQFADVPAPPLNGDQWRINFSRVQWQYDVVDKKYIKKKDTNEDNWVWSPQWEVNMHKPESFGFVQFSELEPDKDKFNFNKERWDSQIILFNIYKLQRKFYEDNKRYASSFKELGIKNSNYFYSSSPQYDMIPGVKLHKLSLNNIYGWEASIVLENEKELKIHHVRGDSKRWESIADNI